MIRFFTGLVTVLVATAYEGSISIMLLGAIIGVLVMISGLSAMQHNGDIAC